MDPTERGGGAAQNLVRGIVKHKVPGHVLVYSMLQKILIIIIRNLYVYIYMHTHTLMDMPMCTYY